MSKQHMTVMEQRQSQTKEYQAAMVKLWAAGIACFGDTWRKQYGEVGEMIFTAWTRALMASFSFESIVLKGSQVLAGWKESFPPTLGQLRTEMLAQGQQGNDSTPPRGPVTAGYAEKYKALQNRINKSPTTREPSANDVESFVDSYHVCGLGNLWGGDPV